VQLHLYRTLWGANDDYSSLAKQARQAGFDGLEGQIPENKEQRDALERALQAHNLRFIAEVTTGGSYVPERHASLQTHLNDIERCLQQAESLGADKINCIGGCDAWSFAQQCDFFGSALAMAEQFSVPLAFETHRSRSLFNPWITRDVVQQFPAIQLTCDFSHWCVVCERGVDSEAEILAEIAPHAAHIHARVGYDQGPQVPHPAAPEYADWLEAHERWWKQIWAATQARGCTQITMTPEFGPDGYLHTLPFTAAPVADLWEINQWMAQRQRESFQQWLEHAGDSS